MRFHGDTAAFHATMIAGVVAVCIGCIVSLYTQEWTTFFAFVALGGLISGAGFAAAALQARPRQRPHWRCASCGYDRRGLPPGAPCPECGPKPASRS